MFFLSSVPFFSSFSPAFLCHHFHLLISSAPAPCVTGSGQHWRVGISGAFGISKRTLFLKEFLEVEFSSAGSLCTPAYNDKVKKQSCSRNRPWRRMGLWDA
jgi:hypothetical protein